MGEDKTIKVNWDTLTKWEEQANLIGKFLYSLAPSLEALWDNENTFSAPLIHIGDIAFEIANEVDKVTKTGCGGNDNE